MDSDDGEGLDDGAPDPDSDDEEAPAEQGAERAEAEAPLEEGATAGGNGSCEAPLEEAAVRAQAGAATAGAAPQALAPKPTPPQQRGMFWQSVEELEGEKRRREAAARRVAKCQHQRVTKRRRRKYARYAAWSDDVSGHDFRTVPRYVPRPPRPLCQGCREPSTGSCASCHRFLCDDCVVVCEGGCEWHGADLCVLCLGGHPCIPVPAECESATATETQKQDARSTPLSHVLVFAACFGASCTALPHPALAATLAYAATWARTRVQPQTHFEHCRAWTLLAVGCVTLGKCLWVTALCTAWLSVCPAWMLWWPKDAQERKQQAKAPASAASASSDRAPTGNAQVEPPSAPAAKTRQSAPPRAVDDLVKDTKKWQS